MSRGTPRRLLVSSLPTLHSRRPDRFHSPARPSPPMPLWLFYALLAAGFAASINLLGKVGMRGIDSDLSTAVRSVVQAAFVAGFAFVVGSWGKLGDLRGRPVAISMIVLCGVAGGLSWIFGFRALQLADVSQVGPIDKLSMPLGVMVAVILLGERPSWTNWAGIGLIALGAFLASRPPAAGRRRAGGLDPRGRCAARELSLGRTFIPPLASPSRACQVQRLRCTRRVGGSVRTAARAGFRPSSVSGREWS